VGLTHTTEQFRGRSSFESFYWWVATKLWMYLKVENNFNFAQGEDILCATVTDVIPFVVNTFQQVAGHSTSFLQRFSFNMKVLQ
jgi:hypothetical protein